MKRSQIKRRPLNLPEHGALELLLGMVMAVAPIAFGLGAAAIVICIVLGSMLMGMGMTLQASRGPALSWHTSFDTVFVLTTAFAALGLALVGNRGGAVFLVVLVAILAVLTFATRYSTGLAEQ